VGTAYYPIVSRKYGIIGVATGKWPPMNELEHHNKSIVANTKEELLARWDDLTKLIDDLWKKVPIERFREIDTAFGEYEGQISGLIQYWIDNEIHHRGQAYVYLRSLGIEPPAFWERS
jgi:uncharacterized damage-inducible protein DinB